MKKTKLEQKIEFLKVKYSDNDGGITLLEGESWELFDEVIEAIHDELREIKEELDEMKTLLAPEIENPIAITGYLNKYKVLEIIDKRLGEKL